MGTENRAERRVVVAKAVMDIEPAALFALLTDISMHAAIDGSGSVIGGPVGPPRLSLGSEFTLRMNQFGIGYRSVSRVVEFEEDRLIAWESMGVWRGRRVIGGQRWRWVLESHLTGTAVSHSYVWGYARWPLLTVWLPGYPARARTSLPRSLERLGRLVSDSPRKPPL